MTSQTVDAIYLRIFEEQHIEHIERKNISYVFKYFHELLRAISLIAKDDRINLYQSIILSRATLKRNQLVSSATPLAI